MTISIARSSRITYVAVMLTKVVARMVVGKWRMDERRSDSVLQSLGVPKMCAQLEITLEHFVVLRKMTKCEKAQSLNISNCEMNAHFAGFVDFPCFFSLEARRATHLSKLLVCRAGSAGFFLFRAILRAGVCGGGGDFLSLLMGSLSTSAVLMHLSY